MASSIWPAVQAERAALLADVEGLDDAQWATPSLCAGWSVRDVLAHMTATAELKPAPFVVELARAGFRLTAMQERHIAQRTQGSPRSTVDRFRSVVSSRTHPPGPPGTWLGETIVHAEDIRRALGIAHEYDPAAATRVAAFYRRSNLIIGGKRRGAGLRLEATDTTWTAGDGSTVRGPAVSLVLAIAGRPAALDDLAGDGVATLRSRMS